MAKSGTIWNRKVDEMEEKLHVCLLNDSFPPVIDGVANTVVNYAHIIEEKHGHAIVGTPFYPDAVDEYSFPVIRYHSVDTTKLVGYRAGYPFSASAMEQIIAQKVDVIHTHCPFVSAMVARTLRKSIGAPVILTYHTKFDIDIARDVKGPLLQSAAVKLIVNNIKACDEVWVVSKGAGENLKGLGYEGDYIVMENGVDFPRGRISENGYMALDESYPIKPDAPVFLFVGRLMWYKGIGIILEALHALRQEGQAFTMIFVGDGMDREAIEDETRKLGLENDCIFTGAIQDREELRRFFCRADLFLFPSTFDTNGIVVREAAACGLGSVLIRNSCAAEGITDGRNGYLIEETAASMAACLRERSADLEGCRQVGQCAMNEIYISWEDSVAKAYERYQVVLDRCLTSGWRDKEMEQDELFGMISKGIGYINRFRQMEHELYSDFRDKGIAEREKLLDAIDRYL